jgi:hypothetical protein
MSRDLAQILPLRKSVRQNLPGVPREVPRTPNGRWKALTLPQAMA